MVATCRPRCARWRPGGPLTFPFVRFVEADDPAAFDGMWTTEGDLLRPAATEESVELWKRYTAEFVTSLES